MDYITPERYAENVDARCSTEFHDQNIIGQALAQHLVAFVARADVLDQYKKFIFYGKKEENHDQIIDDYLALNPNVHRGFGSVHPDGPGAPSDGRDVPIKLSLQQQMMFHAILGLATEAGELVQAFIDGMGAMQNNVPIDDAFDLVNMREEFGDALWYLQLGLNSINSNLSECMTINDNKLERRYGPAFSSDRASNRDLDAERRELEG